MATQELVRDEFNTEEFEGGASNLPYLQLSNNQDPKKCGMFISLENAEECGFKPGKTWQPFTLTFASGEGSEGYLTANPRLLVIRRGELLMYDRENDREIVGKFDRDNYDGAVHVIKTKFLVFVVDANNKPMHDTPLQFTAKGAFSGDFGSNYGKFRTALSNAYGKANGTSKARGDKFIALGVMAFTIEPVLKGDKKKSWACGITKAEHPTADNWKDYFVGYDEATKLLVYDAFEEFEGFGTLASLRREEAPVDDGYGLPPVAVQQPAMSTLDYLKAVASDIGKSWEEASAKLKESGEFKGIRPNDFTPAQIERAQAIINSLVPKDDTWEEAVKPDDIPF